MGVFDTFQRARIVWFPCGSPVSVCEMLLGGCAPPWLNVLNSTPSTKYSHVLVLCAAVSFHWKVTDDPTCVRGHGLLASSRTEKPLPPEHCIEPLGASTLWGSYLMEPQSNDVVPVAQWSWRLGGDVIQPCAEALGAIATGATIAAAPSAAASSAALSLRMVPPWGCVGPRGPASSRAARGTDALDATEAVQSGQSGEPRKQSPVRGRRAARTGAVRRVARARRRRPAGAGR